MTETLIETDQTSNLSAELRNCVSKVSIQRLSHSVTSKRWRMTFASQTAQVFLNASQRLCLQQWRIEGPCRVGYNILQGFWMLKVLVDSGRNASNNSILEEFLRILRRDWGFELPVVAGPGQGGEVSTSGGAGAQDWPGQGRLMIHWFIDFLMIYDTWHIYMYHHVLSCVYDSLNFPFGIRAWKLQMALGTIQFPSKTKMTRPFLHVLVA